MFNQNTSLAQPLQTNPNKDFEVVSPPEDSIASLAFSPSALQQNFLVAGSWDCNLRCWEVEQTGKTVPKSMQMMGGAVLDLAWSDVPNLLSFSQIYFAYKQFYLNCFISLQDGTKVFAASCDKMVKCWDLGSNQCVQVAAHDAPVSTCHWIKGSNYNCLMTGSWDKTLKVSVHV